MISYGKELLITFYWNEKVTQSSYMSLDHWNMTENMIFYFQLNASAKKDFLSVTILCLINPFILRIMRFVISLLWGNKWVAFKQISELSVKLSLTKKTLYFMHISNEE